MSGQLTLGPDGRVPLLVLKRVSGLVESPSHQVGSPSHQAESPRRLVSKLRHRVSKSSEQMSKSGRRAGNHVSRREVAMWRSSVGEAS